MDWKNLLQTLTDQGWTQQQLADKCGCSQSTISDLARGQIESPRFKTGQVLLAMSKRKPRAITARAHAPQAETAIPAPATTG